MDIIVYSGFSKPINSTKQPSGGQTISVFLKHPTSVVNPVFRITGFDTSWNYIQWGNRYYYVRDIVIMTETQAEYICEIDVLATYKTTIGASSQYVVRAASAYNGAINDALYPMTAVRTMQKTNPTVSHGFVMPLLGAYVFGIQGKSDGDTFGCTTYYCMDVYHAKDLLDAIFNINLTDYQARTVEDLGGVPQALYMATINPQQYIVSCKFLPFDAESVGSGAAEDIYFGWYNSGIRAVVFDPSFDELPYVDGTITLPKHPQASRGNYLNNAPFSEYVLSFMPFGDIVLPADLMVGITQIYYKCICDVITGMATLRVYAGTNDSGQLLATVAGKVGVDIAISSGLYDTSSSGAKGRAISGAFASAMQAGLEKMDLGAAAGFTANGVVNSILTPSVSTSGNNGALDFLEYPIVLYSRFAGVVDDDPAQNGKPLCAIRTINTLSGYIKCINVDIDTVGTSAEKAAIISYMERGFFYE